METVKAGTSTSALELSDEEFLAQSVGGFPDDEEDPTQDSEPEVEQTTSDEDTEDSQDTENAQEEAQEQPEVVAEDEEVADPDGDTLTEDEPEANSDKTESLDTEGEDTDTKGDTQDTDKFDFKSAYEKVTAPFKANGTEIQINDPEEVVRLMQMGVGYQRKMQQIKPHLKMVKMLENNGLLDEGKLNNLIDLSKKDPKAVAKLIKDSGIDPLDIDTSKDVEYSPTEYGVSDKEYNLDQAIEGIRESETFQKTIEVMSKQWDSDSKTMVADNPEIISIIDTHMQNGVYDKVMAVVEREKLLGRLDGVADVVAYKQAAEFLASQGQLVQPGQGAPTDKASVSSEPKAKKEVAQLNKKRKAAAPTKKASSAAAETQDNPLELSDEEFMKKYG